MTTLQAVELRVLGPLQVRQGGAPVTIPGAKPRAILTMLGLHSGSVVSAGTLVELLWGDDPPRTADKALQTHISSLRRALGDGFVLTQGAGWTLADSDVDASRYKSAARRGRDAAAAGDTSHALARFEEALALWRGIPELPDGRRGTSEKTRWNEGHSALVEDRADALLATGRAAEIIGELEAAVAEAPLRERRWGQLMLALYRAGRQGEALAAYQRARALLADELGVDPGPDLRRLEAAIVAQDAALEIPVAQQLSAVTRAVTFLLTDIEGSTAAWEADAGAMAIALARHDELVEQVVTSQGGRLIKTRGEGDATFSVFERPSAAAAAAIELQEAIVHEPWALRQPMRIRVALHTGEVELRDGDYFGRAVNRAARLRSLAEGGQILCSGATAELVIDSLRDDVVLTDLGMRELRNLARPEHVFELRLLAADDDSQAVSTTALIERPSLPAVLGGPGPFVGRGRELERLFSAWQGALAGTTNAMLIAGEPGVGKTRLAGEWSRQAYDQGALVIYGRCDEDLGAPYQPFAEALRALVPCLGASGLRGLRGVEGLLALVPGLTDLLPDLAPPTRADPDTERYALFDAVVALFGVASASAPVVLILDDLHWAAKPTLLLLRHLLRLSEHARVQIVGTYRSTDLDRSHPLAAMLADLHRDGTADRLQLSGLDEDDVTAYVAEAGYDDQELARALASVTGGNPFFLIEALRHVDESGGRWNQSTLPQGVREAVTRRLTRLAPETNKALAAAAVVGSRFALELVERVVGDELVDAFDEACKAGIVIEEPGGCYRFNHAIVRQSLLAELPSMRRMRLHQRIATTLESEPGTDDELLAELAYHYFECAWAGNAAKAAEYCRRAADQAMTRLAYEGAADLYDRALHALEELDDELPDRDDQAAELLIARCEALLAAGDVASAAGAVSQLREATVHSPRLAAWATCFDGQLSMLIHPERLDEVEAALGVAAEKLAGLDDAAGEAKAHTVRAMCRGRLGRIGDCEVALDDALTAARRAREPRSVNAVLASAPLAALWGPNPVPRAGGRCLDVVRLLRITTDSPAVEATSTRCQAVLEAFRGRAAAARRMIDSARRTVTELGMRHALLEVEQFAGIVELVVDDPAAAEPHLRQACNGFRRMGLDADTAETAALLGRVCLALDRDAEADELCTESEHLAGHALKPAIAWRTLRAELLSRGNDHDEARRVAQAAVSLAERTDALVDHGDACLALATVLGAAGDVAGARAAAERAAGLYEQKGAAALAEKARQILGRRVPPTAPAPPETPAVEPDNACVQAIRRLDAAVNRDAWDEYEALYATDVVVESRRKIVGVDLATSKWPSAARRLVESGTIHRHVVLDVRGERLALFRVTVTTADVGPGAPEDEVLGLYGLDEEGHIKLAVWFDLEDIEAATAELDAAHARFEEVHLRPRRLENKATRVYDRLSGYFATRDWDALAETLADDISNDDRRPVVGAGLSQGRGSVMTEISAWAELGVESLTSDIIATRGGHLALGRSRSYGPDAFRTDVLDVFEIDADERVVARVVFELDDFEAAIAELDSRYLAGEAAPYARTWSVISGGHAALSRNEMPPVTPDCVSFDHRRGTAFAPGELIAYFRAGIDLEQNIRSYVESVHRLSDLGAVCTHAAQGISKEGFEAEWRGVDLLMVEGGMVNHCEVFNETDVDAALAKFEQLSRPAPQLENAASKAYERSVAWMAGRDWDALTETVARDVSVEDRRRVVNAGIRHGRNALLEDLRVGADIGFTYTMFGVMATRGERLALVRSRASGPDPGAIQNDAPCLVEIDADGRVAAFVVFDLDDFDAALAELDARYLAGEAAAHAHTWSVIARMYAGVNRGELPATTQDWVKVDHRHVITLAPDDNIANLRAVWDLMPDRRIYIDAVHRLCDLGAVLTFTAKGTSQEGFEAEWRVIHIVTVDGDLVSRSEMFDEADLDTALAKFEQLSRPAPRLKNAASQAYKRILACIAARDWDAVTETVAEDCYTEDRRRVVNSGIRHGRDAGIEEVRAAVDVGLTITMVGVMATRGARLALTRVRASGPDPGASQSDAPTLVELDSDGRIAATVVFDLDDFDAAIAELDARYLAGEAAAHGHTWSVITRAYAAANRHELPATTPDWVNIDHRRGRAFGPGELGAYMRASWDLIPDTNIHIEAVHRLSNLGAVVTHAVHGTSRDGFDAEWRELSVSMVDGDCFNRSELFDEADLDAALAKFDQLSRPAPRLENAASQVAERFWSYFAAHDWDAMAELLTDDLSSEDRRGVVGAGIQHGRNALIADMRALADLWSTNVTLTVIATRGERLALFHVRLSGRDQGPGAFLTEVLAIIEIDADERMLANVAFDPDDFDAAFEELDARYLAGEAAAHARTWSVIKRGYAAASQHEIPAMTPDCVTIDHRRTKAFAPGELTAYIRAGWELDQNIRTYVEVVQRLSDLGAVCTYAAQGVSHEGFDAEWREVAITTVEGDMANRCELFDAADLDAALAKFEQLSRPEPRLENAASQIGERYLAHRAAGDWDAVAEILADNFCSDDRRRVVGAGVRHGRDALIADMRAIANLSIMNMTSTVMAIRGKRLVLMRASFSDRDQGPGGFLTEVLVIVEINADDRIVAAVTFDPNDFEAATAELDGRYLAGEAAANAHTWSVIVRGFASVNRHELPALTPDLVSIDHRRAAAYGPGELIAYVRAGWSLDQRITTYVESVHRLNNLGAVVTHAAHGSSQEGFDAEWRGVDLLTVDGDMCNRCEVFDEEDLDTAITKFDQLSRPAPHLENAASQVYERFWTCFAARDWDAFAELLADDISMDDRRRVVNAGLRLGRGACIADMRAVADVGTADNVTSTVIATRGERLTLNRIRSRELDTELLNLVELNSDERIIASAVVFDLDDIGAAFAELDARYLAGEAAAHTHTWSVITRAISALNRREMPPTTPDWVTIDHHRHGVSFGPGELPALLASWYLAPEVSSSIEVVHRLNDFGAVFSSASYETSQEGVNAEWRVISVLTVEGDLIDRFEAFDEADLDAALVRFDELCAQERRLENAASRTYERLQACFLARDWDVLTEMLAADVCSDDRRRGVNAGMRRGREAAIQDARAMTDLWITNVTSTVIATRGERLVLMRARYLGRNQGSEAFYTDVLNLIEIDADGRINARISFDANDVDAAFQELDAQYLAGEAAAYADMWSVITHGYATLNRHELPATTSDSVTVDHRVRARFEGGDLAEYIHSGWDVAPDLKIYIEAVYRLSNRGAVFTHVAYGTSPEGFDAEWRMIVLLEVGGDQVHRCELFDEADLDAALARFEELRPQMPRLENAASRADERVIAYFAARNWDGMAEVLADDYYLDDRRPVVNIGIKHGRDVAIADMQASAELELTSCPIATRSERLVLSRVRWSWSDQHAEGFHTEALNVIEINADERITARIWFDANAIGAAFEELDARYLAGEATVYAGMWSVITSGCAALNRHELPPNTSDLVSIDHRRGGHAFATGDLPEFLRATWELMPQARIHIEAVHRLSNLGAVVTSVGHGTSQEGFDAEWRMTELVTLEGGKINRCELFDEEDRDAALARFEELHPQTRRLENAASRVAMRVWTCFAARDWEAMAELFADDISTDDRRRVVNAGVFLGRDAQIANLRTTSELGANITSTVIATRGERLALTRICGSNEDFSLEMLSLIEVGADYRATAGVQFDPDDFETAFAELDARYLAGEAAAHSHAWSVIMRACAVFNRHELPPTTSDSVIIDHRSLVTKEAVDLAASVRAGWDLTPDVSTYIEAVHRLSDLGAVVTLAMKGTSQEGFDAEWRMIAIFTVQGELISCCEIFDEADLDAALARFEELHPHTPQLENAASQVGERYSADFTAGDWDAMAEILADDFSSEDRRRVVGAGVAHGRDAEIVDMRAIADLGLADLTSTVIAIRGERLVLSRSRFSDRDHGPEALLTEVLTILEINADERIVATVVLDPNDFDAAFEELDARYAAGEAAEHAHAWSVIARGCATFNRHEPAATTPDPIYIDHRPVVSIEGVDLAAAQRLVWDLTPVARTFIEAVHRLSELGAVVTHVVKGTSPEGFDAEWRMISILTVEGDLISRCEVFDEPDLDAALARFDELRPQARRLENNASRMYDRYNAYLAAREWDALAEMVTDDICDDDRRRVVSGGIRRGRDAQMANVRAIVGVGVKTFESDVIATRGERLALTRTRVSGGAQRPEVFGLELLNIIEIDTENRIAAGVSFDLEDIDAAFEELDSRYLAGEAAAHAHTWSLVTRGCAAFNRHEPAATTPDPVYIDHRPLVSIEGVDLAAAQRAVWDLTPDARTFIEAVHRLSELGAVVTQVVKGTSPEGFDAEWQMVSISTFEGDLISRYEVFDEADLDAALARFDELHPQARRLENAASQVYERFWAYSAAREWDAMAETLGDGSFAEDRRRVVSAGLFQGRGAVITMMRALADVRNITWTVMAIRGERLALTRFVNRRLRDEKFDVELLTLVEIDPDNKITAHIAFDLDDIDAALEELEARYLAGEAAEYAHTWSVIAQTYAAFNRHELPTTTPDSVYIDHRPLVSIETAGMAASARAVWDLTPDVRICIEAVHRLSELGAVATGAMKGTSPEGFEAEWQMINIYTVDGDRLSRFEVFGETDLDAALARFEELHSQRRELENAASRAGHRFFAHFRARNWAAIADALAEDTCVDDRRRVVNAGLWDDRDVVMANMQALAEGWTNIRITVIATRGERLALARICTSNPDVRHGEFDVEMLAIVEIDTYERVTAQVLFGLDDFDGAFAELDARYLAGEAADHSHAWSVIAPIYAAFNRHELPATDWVNIDHRRGTPFASSDPTASIRALWDLTPDLSIHIETVHRLSSFGAVVTHMAHGTSAEGFDAEWRMILLLTVESDRIKGCELFDEADLDAALARFDELQPQAPQLENAASRVYESYREHFAARDWVAMAELLTADTAVIDHRPVVNSGVRRGRDVEIANMQGVADIGAKKITSTVIATRGDRLALCRTCIWGQDEPEGFRIEFFSVVEIDAEERIVARVAFDPNDIDAAFEELDARYLAGEAAAHSHTWSVLARECAAFNRHELQAAEYVTLDHRQLAIIDATDPQAAMRAIWDVTPDLRIHIEEVHRLSGFGAVATYTAYGTSPEGFDAEWRMIYLLTVEGDRINRCEIFDEPDLDAALAHFEELHRQTRRLENKATRAEERFFAYYKARDWAAIAEILADDTFIENRTPVVNTPLWEGRDVVIANMQALADAVTNSTSAVVAIRGERLALTRNRFPNSDARYGEFVVEQLIIAEIDTDGRIAAHIVIDPDDMDAAIAELDARYLAGEAAAHAHTWSLVTGAYAANNRREIPPITPDFVSIDHRRGIAFEPGDLVPYMRATWDLMPGVKLHIETVHRLTNIGAVVTHVALGASQAGFDAEWRELVLLTFEGALSNHCEMFDEADLDAAIARFEELQPHAPRPENAASQVYERFWVYYASRDWDAMAEVLAEGIHMHDRRRVVNAGAQRGRDVALANMRAMAEIGAHITSTVIGTRGQRLVLTRICSSNSDLQHGEFRAEMFSIIQIDADNRIAGGVIFDIDDIDAAFEELDARYLAGEAAAHAQTWSVVTQGYAALNRHEIPPTTPDFVSIDHRRGIAFEPGALIPYVHATWDVTPESTLHIETVHRLTNIGAVVTHIAHGTSQEGFDAEWRELVLSTFEGDRSNRCEMFDEADLDLALARFEELQPPAPLLENAATRTWARSVDAFNRRDVDDYLALMSADGRLEDRRKGLGALLDGPARRKAVHALFEPPESWRLSMEPIAIRGSRLSLTRECCRDTDAPDQPITIEVLTVVEVDDDDLIHGTVSFDADDINAAFEELNARYLVGEAAAHAHTWSVISRLYAGFNRHELPATTPDWSYVDHRPLVSIKARDLSTSIRALWEQTREISIYMESIHRLSDLGAVVTHTASGTSQEGFDAEWRMIYFLTIEGDLISRLEVFDEADLDAALARFDELDRPAPAEQT